MRFSQRTNWHTEESELAQSLRRRRELGLPVLDLTASNPTHCNFDYPENLLDALCDPSAMVYDPDPRGILSARQAVCEYYCSHGAKVIPSQVLLTTSTSEAYSYLFRLLCDTGDEVLVPQPSYPLFDYLADLEDVCLRPAPFVYDHGWQIDPEGLRRQITPRTRAIVLVHPNNPTGHYTKQWERSEFAAICREHDLSLIVDEVFLDYTFGIHAESFVSGLENIPVFVVSGLSKIAALPQMKSAWIVAVGEGTEAALGRLEVIADTFLSMNAPVQSALPSWLTGRTHIQTQILSRVRDNLSELDRQLASQQLLRRLHVEGGWYAVLRIPAIRPDEHTALALLEHGVLVHPGYFFGMEESGWLVISLLSPTQDFSQGVKTICQEFLEESKK